MRRKVHSCLLATIITHKALVLADFGMFKLAISLPVSPKFESRNKLATDLEFASRPGRTSSRQTAWRVRMSRINTKHKGTVSPPIVLGILTACICSHRTQLNKVEQDITPFSAFANVLPILIPHHRINSIKATQNLVHLRQTNSIQDVHHEDIRDPRPRRPGSAAATRKLHLPLPSRRDASAARMAPQRRGPACGASPPVSLGMCFLVSALTVSAHPAA